MKVNQVQRAQASPLYLDWHREMASTIKPTLSAQWTKLAVLPPRNAVRNADGEMEVDGEDSDEWEEDEVSQYVLCLSAIIGGTI